MQSKRYHATGVAFATILCVVLYPAFVFSANVSHQALLPPPEIHDNPFAASEAARLFAFYQSRPANADICINIAKILASTSSPEKAVPWFTQALSLVPNSDCRKALIDLLLYLKKPAAALPHAEYLVRQAPHDIALVSKAFEIAVWADMKPKISEFAEILSCLSPDESVWKRCMELQRYANNPSKALTLANKLLTAHPSDAALLQTAADLAESAGNRSESIRLLQRAQSVSPTLERGKTIISRIVAIGNIPKAQQEFKVFQQMFGSSKHATALIADLGFEVRLATEALLLMDRLPVEELTPERIIRRAELKRMTGNISDAIDDLRHILEAYPRTTDKSSLFSAYLKIAEADCLLGHFSSASLHYRLALHYYSIAHTTDTADDNVIDSLLWSWVQAARSTGIAGIEEEALKPLATRNTTNPSIFLRLSGLAEARSDVRSEIEYLHLGLKTNPGNFDLERALAKAFLTSNTPLMAKPFFESCLAQKPNDVDARDGLVHLAELSGDYERIVFLLRNVYPSTHARDVLLKLAPALAKTGHSEEALELILAHLENDPFDAEIETTFNSIAETHLEYLDAWQKMKPMAIERKYSALLACVDEKLASDPNDLKALSERASIRLWQNDPTKALVDLEKILAIKPDDRDTLRRTIDAAEWSGLIDKSLALRETLQDLDPEDASNTLRIAQLHGWRHAQHIAWPLYSKLLSRTDLDSIQLYLPAFPVAVWAGCFDDAHRMHDSLRLHISRMNPSERRDFDRQSVDLRDSIGPRISFTSGFRHDSETIRDQRSQITARHSVTNGSAQESSFERIFIAQTAHGNRDFQGAMWRNTWIFPNADGVRWSFGLGVLDNRSDGTSKLLIPQIAKSSSHRGQTTDLVFEEQPIFDTPEALRRNLTLRRLSLSHIRPLADNCVTNWWMHAGTYSPGGCSTSLGAAFEQRPANANFGWRYQCSYEDTNTDGGNVFYSPHHLVTHRVSLFGEYSFDDTRFRWEFEAGREMKLADFHGSRASVFMPLQHDWNIQMDGSVLNTTRSHFGGGQRGFQQWQLQTRLEHTSW